MTKVVSIDIPLRKSIILLCNHFLSEPKAYIWYADKDNQQGKKE